MIAQGRGVETEHVGDLKNRHAFVDCRNGRPLRQIAGVEQNAIDATFALVADGRRQISETPVVVIERTQAGVEIVRVEDGQRSDLRTEWECEEDSQNDEPAGTSCAWLILARGA